MSFRKAVGSFLRNNKKTIKPMVEKGMNGAVKAMKLGIQGSDWTLRNTLGKVGGAFSETGAIGKSIGKINTGRIFQGAEGTKDATVGSLLGFDELSQLNKNAKTRGSETLAMWDWAGATTEKEMLGAAERQFMMKTSKHTVGMDTDKALEFLHKATDAQFGPSRDAVKTASSLRKVAIGTAVATPGAVAISGLSSISSLRGKKSRNLREEYAKKQANRMY